MKKLSDKELLELIRKDNMLAYNELFERYWDGLFQASYKVLRESAAAEDAVQEVFFDLWVRRPELNVTSVAGYLHGAVRFQSFKQLRKMKLSQDHLDKYEQVIATNTTEELLDFNELTERVEQSLNQLPPKYRKVYQMSRVEEMSNKEIAKKLRLSPRTIDWYLHEVLTHLKGSVGTSAGIFMGLW